MKKLHNIYTTLLEHYGPQNWWPADTQIEIMTGSILVQNTNWTNVTPCIQALTPYLSIEGIQSLSTQELQDIIRPSGFSTRKAQTIKDLINIIHTKPTRDQLLEIHGIGRETADCIMLYAYDEPCFVIDTYLKRLFKHCGLPQFKTYSDYQNYMTIHLPKDTLLYKEYHALIVAYGKDTFDPLKTMHFNHTQNDLNYLSKQSTTMKHLIATHKPFNRLTHHNPLDALINAIIGQVISTSLAQSIKASFDQDFPDQMNAPKHNLRYLKLSQTKADTIQRVLVEINEGRLKLDELHDKDDETIFKALTSIKGIGPWTAKVVLIHGYYRDNVSIEEDLVLRKSVENHYPNQSFDDVMNQFSPHQSLASIILWKTSNA